VAGRYPGAAYLFSWYGGIYPASYSLLVPYLLALTGTREAMAVAAARSAALLTPAQITVRMSHDGTTVVRVRWSPLLRSTGGATVARRGEWTSLAARRAGAYTRSARY
jgi:hypothetical protein